MKGKKIMKGKRLLNIIIAVALIITIMPSQPIKAATRGTALYTAEDLLKMSGSKEDFYLANDIDMLEYGLWDPIDFSGSLDGNGFTISNLQVSDSCGGLFYQLSGATVTNLRLADISKKVANIEPGRYDTRKDFGGLASYAENSNISYISLSGKESISFQYRSDGYVGGIVGKLYNNSCLENSYNNMRISVTATYFEDYFYIGGLVGECTENSSVSNCYNTGEISFSDKSNSRGQVGKVAGLVGYLDKSKLKRCYNVGSVTATGSENSESYTVGDISSSGTVYNCYVLSGTANYNYSWYPNSTQEPRVYSYGESELKEKSTYADWDFEDVWAIDPEINEGYPYLISEIAGKPTADYEGGTYRSEICVSLATSTPEATIYYTLDGSEPDTYSYIYDAPISVSKTTVLRAIAVADGYKTSDIAEYRYIYTIDKPKANKKGGKYAKNIKVALTCPTDGVRIYYTTDGSVPTINSRVYESAIKIKKTTTLKAVAVKGDAVSSVYTVRYKIKKS